MALKYTGSNANQVQQVRPATGLSRVLTMVSPAGRIKAVLTHRLSPFACAGSSPVGFFSRLLGLSGFISLKVNDMNSLKPPSGSPELPGRQPYCANRQSR